MYEELAKFIQDNEIIFQSLLLTKYYSKNAVRSTEYFTLFPLKMPEPTLTTGKHVDVQLDKQLAPLIPARIASPGCGPNPFTKEIVPQ